MEENSNLLESLLEKAAEYGKTSLELAKLRALDKSSDIVSSLVPGSVVLALITSFLFFSNFGIALWLGEILGKTYYGFFIVAAFYGLIGLIMHFFLRKRFKKIVNNYFIRKVLK